MTSLPLASSAAPVHSHPEGDTDNICLVDLAAHEPTVISSLSAPEDDASSGVVRRLTELGFMAGETICVLQHGPGGREPIAVQVGDTIFALRRHEASCIHVKANARRLVNGLTEGSA